MLTEEQNIITVPVPQRNNVGDSFSRNLIMQKFIAAVKALEDVIDHETGLLEQHVNPDFVDINSRKTRGIRILNQTMAELSKYLDEDLNLEIENLLKILKIKLERNSRVLKIHFEAVDELVNMLRSAFEAQETDGTYNPFSLNVGRF
ncbi:MAG: hypothetical protein JSC189_000305 [Candidatus Tokpelaia sp. JSC189]|nr:MAG: hypothetical protein JSC189_000305 [Candidatus Tokpelaia sp. JSC189]